MNNRPPIDRELLIPILIGGLSVVGIVVVLLIGYARNTPAEVTMTPSSTPFQYIYLGTEPAITTLVVEGSELPLTEEPITEEPFPEEPVLIATTRPPVATPIILTLPNTTRTLTSTPSRAPTATSSTAAAANTYDDTDSRLSYNGNWVSQTGVSGAYQDTLHISSAVGNSVTFSFTGTEFHLFYQAGPSLGTITITIDSFGEPPISQAQSTTQIREWMSDTLSSGNHIVVIAHAGGGSINIDRFFIPVPTPTPTKTPTP
jgi:hypothetical protein